MVVPIVLGRSTFSYEPLRAEQARLAKTLVLPSPRDKDDTAQTLEIEDNQATPFKYPTFVKVRYGKEGTLPIFELWMKDNFDQEYKVSKESVDGGATIQPPPYTMTLPGGGPYTSPAQIGSTDQGINDDPQVSGTIHLSRVRDSYAINPVTGDIWRNAFWDANPATGRPTIRNAAGVAEGQPGFLAGANGPQLIGTIKFDGATGLALAAVNTRIADISNAVEGITKVLSVASSNIDNVINLIR